MRVLFLTAFFSMGFCAAAYGQSAGWGNPSQEWNGHIRFTGPSEQQVNLNRADMIERQKGGYYDQWSVTQYSTTNNYGDTNIETMNNSNSIGSQVQNNVSVEGNNNNVGQYTDAYSSNSGSTSADTDSAKDSTVTYSTTNN